jgi:hypothetical protein
MNRKALITLVCIFGILGSIVWLCVSFSSHPPKVDLDPYKALGAVAAQETARLLPQKGSVVIISRDYSSETNVVQDAQLQALEAALQQAGFNSVAKETFNVPRLEVFSRASIPRERFLEVLQAHPKTAAMVLFAALPQLEPADLDRLKKSGAKIVSICGFRPADQALLDSGVISLAIVPRTEQAPEAANPDSGVRGVFDAHYTIVPPGKPSGTTP